MTSRSCPTFLQSQIFYVPKNQALVKANVRFYASCWPWVPSGSALRAGALALAPTFTGLRAGGGPRLAWRPARALLHSRGGATGALAPFSLDLRIYTCMLNQARMCRGKQGNGPLRKPRSKRSAK